MSVPINGDLAAFYDTTTQTLTVSAQGKVLASLNPQLVRDVWVGAIKYSLVGRWFFSGGGGGDIGLKDYEIDVKDQVFLPSPVINSHNILVSTEDNPEGEQVEIHYGGLKLPRKRMRTLAAPSTPASLIEPVETLVVFYGEAFKIKLKPEGSPNNRVNIVYPREVIEMIDATIAHEEVTWTLKQKKNYPEKSALNIRVNVGVFPEGPIGLPYWIQHDYQIIFVGIKDEGDSKNSHVVPVGWTAIENKATN